MPAVTDVSFVPVRVRQVTALPQAARDQVVYFVVLDTLDGDRHLVIGGIGQEQALGLASALSGKEWPRPMTYQFMVALVGALDGHVREVRLDRMVDGAYAALVEVEGPTGVAQGIDARSSDALSLAVLLGAPIFVARGVLDDCARRLEGETPEAAMMRQALTANPIGFR